MAKRVSFKCLFDDHGECEGTTPKHGVDKDSPVKDWACQCDCHFDKLQNQKGETLIDIISIAAMLACWIVPPAVFAAKGWTGGWWWLAWWIWVGVSLGAFELTSKIVTGRTLSQHFWRWSAKVDPAGRYVNKWKAIGTLVLWTFAWGILMVHLSWKLITGRRYSEES